MRAARISFRLGRLLKLQSGVDDLTGHASYELGKLRLSATGGGSGGGDAAIAAAIRFCGFGKRTLCEINL